MVVGENGLMGKAETARLKSEYESDKEKRSLAMGEAATNMKNTVYEGVTIPAGFAPTRIEGESTVEEGLVIIDNNGSEFVWVPINEDLTVMGTDKVMAKLSTGEYAGEDDNGRKNYEGALYNIDTTDRGLSDNVVQSNYGQQNKYTYREPVMLDDFVGEHQKDAEEGITDKLLQEEYNEIIESIIKNHGFYVSRYEMGVENGKPVSKLDITSTAADEETSQWYGLYRMAKNYTNRYNSVKSSMIWGSQYDAIMNYILIGPDKEKVASADFGDFWGNHHGYGKTSEGFLDKMFNIYDLAGHCMEWTLEARGRYNRTLRGGSGARVNSPGGRSYNTPLSTVGYTTRITLIIN